MINSYNPSFGTKFDTVKILEASTLKYIESEHITDLKPVIETFWDKPFKAAGHKGYRYYLQEIGQRICNKYPEINDAVSALKRFSQDNPNAKREELQQFINPLIEKLGKEIDITI